MQRLKQLEQLIRLVMELKWPADAVISRFFREHPRLGQRDRAFLAEGAWSVLRHRSWYSHLSSAGTGSMSRRFSLLAAHDLIGMEALAQECSPSESDWLSHVATLRATKVSDAVRFSMPDWIEERLRALFSKTELRSCLQSLVSTAPLDLRVNTILAKPEEVIAALAERGIEATPLDIMPEALRVLGKPALQKAPAFTKGLFEVQDLGSQLLTKLLAAKRGQTVVDFCAGAGGKTLAIGAAMRNTGRIYALDTSVQRLSRLKPRLARSGLSNVWPQAISGQTDSRLSRLRAKADAVLVDAPCSGLGTLRRNPDLKWRITPQSVRELVAQQSAILKSAGRLVKPSGRLVYATCSLLAEENDQLVEQFLLDHPDFRRLSALEVLSAQKILLPDAWQAYTAAGDLWLWPHRSGTDGFFAAVLTRAGDSHQGVG